MVVINHFSKTKEEKIIKYGLKGTFWYNPPSKTGMFFNDNTVVFSVFRDGIYVNHPDRLERIEKEYEYSIGNKTGRIENNTFYVKVNSSDKKLFIETTETEYLTENDMYLFDPDYSNN